MNLEIVRLENQLMNSNTYIIVENGFKSCVIIDPAYADSEREIRYIKENSLSLYYTLLTHTHPDHCLGVNSLKRAFPQMRLVYHDDKYKKREFNLFFRLIKDENDSSFDIIPADLLIEKDEILEWYGHKIKLIVAPGHSMGSICIDIDRYLFTGDTMIPYPPFFNGRGSNKDEWASSVKKILESYNPETLIFPGHGEALSIGEWNINKEYSECK